MRQFRNKWLLTPALLLFAFAMFPLTASASTKTISGVNIHVKSELEAGDTLSSSDLVVGDDETKADRGVCVWVSNEKYSITEAKFVSYLDKTLQIGNEVKIRVRLEPNDNDNYAFKGSYSSSNVSISGGEYVSTTKSSGDLLVTFKVKPVRGTYDPPETAEWKDSSRGHAKWTAPDYTSGHYDVILKRGGSEVVRKTDIGSTSYNFYPYMTKAGTYSFRVRTVPHSSSSQTYGKASEWVESDEYYLDADHVSDGSGQNADGSGNSNVTNDAGWQRTDGIWYFKYPDGTLKKDGWGKVDDRWYLFDSTGRMLTGWQTIKSGTYFLSDSGDMMTGWQNLNGQWYLLNPDPESPTMGALVKNMLISDENGNAFYLSSKGERASGWTKVDDHWSYFDPTTGIMARNQVINSFYVDADGIWKQ